MSPSDAARELDAILDAERQRHYPAGSAGAVEAIAGRRRVEALELAIAVLGQPAARALAPDHAAS